MANTKSAEKQNRQRIKRRARNLFHLTTTRTLVKRAVASMEEGTSPSDVQDKVRAAIAQIDKAAQKGVLKKKTASRKVSRLARALARSAQGSQSATRA